jgi:hypothetical protein
MTTCGRGLGLKYGDNWGKDSRVEVFWGLFFGFLGATRPLDSFVTRFGPVGVRDTGFSTGQGVDERED